MHSYGFLFSALFVLAELFVFAYFLFRRLKTDKLSPSEFESLDRIFTLTKVLMGVAIAYPTLLIIFSFSLDSLNIINAIFYALAIGPVICEAFLLKRSLTQVRASGV